MNEKQKKRLIRIIKWIILLGTLMVFAKITEDIFENEQYKARENIVEVEHLRLGKIKVPGVVPKFSETPGAIRHRAPELGEHNEEIYGALGISAEEIAALKDEGII